MKKKSNRTHKSSKEKYYIPYLPDEVFENLTPELRKTQQEYRTYHKTLHGIRERINTNELLIKKLKGEIENDKYRIKKGANEKYPEDGYEELVGFRFEKLSHLYDDYKNSISITRKNRSSSSFKKNQEDLEKYGRLETTEGNMRKQFYGGKEISEIITFNAQIKSNNYLHSYINGDSSNKKIKNISLGTEEVMRKNLGLLYPKIDFSEDSIDEIKEEWRTIIKAYTNWFLTKKKWIGLKTDTHPKEKIVDWCIKMGINEKNPEFDKWIHKEG